MEISCRVCKILLFAHAEKNMFTNEQRVQRVAHPTGFGVMEISCRVCKILLFAHAEKNMFTNEQRVQRVAHPTGFGKA